MFCIQMGSREEVWCRVGGLSEHRCLASSSYVVDNNIILTCCKPQSCRADDVISIQLLSSPLARCVHADYFYRFQKCYEVS